QSGCAARETVDARRGGSDLPVGIRQAKWHGSRSRDREVMLSIRGRTVYERTGCQKGRARMRFGEAATRRAGAMVRVGLNGLAMGVLVLLPLNGVAGEGVVADVTSCLVKPRQQIQLGSPVFGVLAGVFVDWGMAVKEGQVLAKLDTTVEEAQVALDRYRTTL